VFTRMRNGMEAPAQLPAANVISSDITRSGRQGFRIASANDEQAFVDDWRAGEGDRHGGRIAPEILAQVDAALIAEAGNRLSGIGIQFVNKVHDAADDASVVPMLPVRQSAVRLRAGDTRIELPLQCSGCGAEGENFLRGRYAVENSMNDDGTRLQPAAFAAVVSPGNTNLAHIGTVDLSK